MTWPKKLPSAGVVQTVQSGLYKGWKYIDEDWFRFWYLPGTPDEAVGRDKAKKYEIHELCTRRHCSYREGDCPWHPEGCACSEGACQEGAPPSPFRSRYRERW